MEEIITTEAGGVYNLSIVPQAFTLIFSILPFTDVGDNITADLSHMQPHFYHMRQMEPTSVK